MHFTCTKSSPSILLLLKYKKCSARMEAILIPQMICFTDRSKVSESFHVKMLHCWKSHVAAYSFLFCPGFDMLSCVHSFSYYLTFRLL